MKPKKLLFSGWCCKVEQKTIFGFKGFYLLWIACLLLSIMVCGHQDKKSLVMEKTSIKAVKFALIVFYIIKHILLGRSL